MQSGNYSSEPPSQQADRKSAKTGVTIFVLILLLLFLTVIIGLIPRFIRSTRQKQNMKELEILLQQEDFAALTNTYYDIDDCLNPVYDDYYAVIYAYEMFTSAEQLLRDYYEYELSGDLSEADMITTISWIISPAIVSMQTARQELDDQVTVGNETALEHLYKQSHDLLTEHFLLTDEEIEETLATAPETSYTSNLALPLAEAVYERLQETP